MADINFPSHHTTTTTVTSSTRVQTNLRYDPIYVKTKEGILKIVQLVLNLLGFICIQCSQYGAHSTGGWFSSVAMTGLWFTGILLILYLFHVIEKFYKIPWLKIEFFFCIIWMILYLIFSCLVVTYNSQGYVVAGVFGFLAMIAYGLDAFFKYRAVQMGELAQGERQMSKETTTVSSPAY